MIEQAGATSAGNWRFRDVVLPTQTANAAARRNLPFAGDSKCRYFLELQGLRLCGIRFALAS